MLVEHHTKYKEIHGIDETVWMPKGEHYKLHNRLRKEGKCNIPVKELERISCLAQKRTIKGKVRTAKYEKNRVCRAFVITLTTNIRLCIWIKFNINANSICINSSFQGRYGTKLYYIDLKE